MWSVHIRLSMHCRSILSNRSHPNLLAESRQILCSWRVATIIRPIEGRGAGVEIRPYRPPPTGTGEFACPPTTAGQENRRAPRSACLLRRGIRGKNSAFAESPDSSAHSGPIVLSERPPAASAIGVPPPSAGTGRLTLGGGFGRPDARVNTSVSATSRHGGPRLG